MSCVRSPKSVGVAFGVNRREARLKPIEVKAELNTNVNTIDWNFGLESVGIGSLLNI